MLNCCVAVLLITSGTNESGTTDEVDKHIAALKADDKDGRIKAAKALAKLGPKAEPAIPVLIKALSDSRPDDYNTRVGNLCARALVAIGKPAIDPLMNALELGDVGTFIGAADALQMLPQPPDRGLKVLVKEIRNYKVPNKKRNNLQRAWVATRVLSAYGPRAAGAVDDIMPMLDDKNFRVQLAACEALASIGGEAGKAVPRLLELLKEGNTSVRGNAALALGAIGSVEGHDVIKPLATSARTEFPVSVRARALAALAVQGEKAKDAIPVVKLLMNSTKYGNRHDAAFAYWRITGDATRPVEVLVERTKSINTELEALAAICKMGPAAVAAAPDLLPQLESKDPDKRFEVAQALILIAGGNPDVQARLKKLAMEDPDEEVRRMAAKVNDIEPDRPQRKPKQGQQVRLPSLGDTMTDAQVTLFANLALKNIDIEYPNKPSNVMAGPESVQSPKEMHPAFYGSFDWHSSIHGHWMLVRLLKLHPDCSAGQRIRASLNEHLTAANMKVETEYFAKKHNKSFERMYGWAWAFRLAIELDGWDDEDGKRWRKAIRPLEDLLVQRTMDYLPKLTYPIRTGVHPDSGFALGQTLDYARAMRNRSLEDLVVKRARDFYLADRDYPFRYEPSGQDFFSSGWNEADLMRRVLPASEFSKWLDGFMGDISSVKPVEVSDVTDGHIVHLAGLDLSRAWCMQGIASALGDEDARAAMLRKSAANHAKMGFGYIFSGSYEGEHWLATFAIYTLSRVGVSP